MKQAVKQGKAARRMLVIGLLLAAGGIVLEKLTRDITDDLETYVDDPATNYETAIARLARVQAEEEADATLNPVCRAKLLTHGRKVERAIILMHGMTNCPEQFAELAPLFYAQGYNVLIPRMPCNGLADCDTDTLKNLTAQDLLECGSSMIAIAHGLGERVIYAGLSVGGTMAAWVAQYRPDVEQAVLIAPAFTISRGLGVGISRFAMRLFLIMPNIMTQRFRPFKEGPPHNYHGFSTRGLGEMMRLGFSVYDTAKTRKPAAQSVLVITNASDPAVDNNITRQLVKRWQASGMEHIETYEFDAHYQSIHDVIDPQQPRQQTELVYPILLDLMIHSQATMANSTASSLSI